MGYDDSRFRGETVFRDEPEYGAPAASGESSGLGYGSGFGSADYGSESRPASLDNVFDNPEHGEPGRDRMGIHLLWELVLLLGVVSVAVLLRVEESSALRGESLENLLVMSTALGLVTVGMSLTLRAGVPNLALGTIAYACALFFAENSDRGLTPTAAITILIAAAIGLALAIGVVAFHVPAWAASLGVMFAILVWFGQQRSVNVVGGAYRPGNHAMYWFAAFAALSIVGGLFGAARPVRRALGRFRPVADPARRRGGQAAFTAALTIVASSALAAAGGVLLALHVRTVPASSGQGLGLTGLALGAALLAGTSAFGRRGGVFGTTLAVVLVVLLPGYIETQGWFMSDYGMGASAILAGLVVTRLIETFGRPRPGEGDLSGWGLTSGSGTGDDWSSGSSSGGWTGTTRTTDDGWGGDGAWSSR